MDLPFWLTIILLPALKVSVSLGFTFSAVALGVLFTPEPSVPMAASQPASATADLTWSSVAARPGVILFGSQVLLAKPLITPSLPSIPTVPIVAFPSLPSRAILSPAFTEPFLPSMATAFVPSPALIVPSVPLIATALPSLPALIVPFVPSTVTALVGSVPNVTLSFNLLS